MQVTTNQEERVSRKKLVGIQNVIPKARAFTGGPKDLASTRSPHPIELDSGCHVSSILRDVGLLSFRASSPAMTVQSR